jgi:hypothetical protein
MGNQRDLAIVAAAAATDVRDQLEVILRNSMWLFTHGYTISASREFVVDPSGGGGFAVGLLADAGLTPATRAA